ncbi:helix-turn-helix domain-containing protein [Brevundimonas sp.]|uniref:helix-turn-helix domain-containing protein n=1 Tax=Brevundimonas sp. TaxID=1871086 RepID=UPI0028B1F024|nr:helix-turn-helix domain-containing protein [Brevundimonas sp.]
MSAANDNKLAYGIEEAAQAISVGKSTIWRWIHDGRVKTIKLGGRTLIRREELMRLLDEAA